MHIVSKIVALIVMGAVTFIAISPVAGLFKDAGLSNFIFLGMLALVVLLCLTAPTGRRAWGRSFLLAGILMIALPFTLSEYFDVVLDDWADAASGAGAFSLIASLGAGFLILTSLFVGIISGTLFIIFGLIMLLGGRREEIVVETESAN